MRSILVIASLPYVDVKRSIPTLWNTWPFSYQCQYSKEKRFWVFWLGRIIALFL